MPTVKYSVSAYTADGTTTDYLITWDYLDDDHITVEVDGVSNDDPQANHTFVKLNDTTVRVTDGIGGAIAAGSEIQIRRNTPITTRPISFADGSALLASDLNKNSDYLLYAMQEALDEVDFTVQYQEEAEGFKDATEALRDETQVLRDATEVDSNAADAHRIAAATSETNAATSETNAATSETNAATSETNAATSETNAAASAAAALASEGAAATSETNASTSETNAAASAAAAAGSEAGVAADAATASAKASQASVSEANAATSATNSQASANNSAISATNSANSATASASSASAAATSESNAATSEGAAASSAASALVSKNAAAASQTAAAASETAAAASETAAAASEAAASTSETNAAASETAAAASQAAAATSEANAATSETNAATSETNAASSASAAATSETNAANSATAAASSQTAAATSETNAATSETNAATSETNAASSATSAASSASTATSAKDAALAALDSFDDRYLGVKSSDPTTDNDGNTLISGTLYYNDTDDVMKVYEGSQWVAAYASLSGAVLQANNLSDVASVATSRVNLGVEIGVDVQAYSATLANTTASYTTAEESKLAGIETGATADQTGAEIKTAYEAQANTNAFTDSEKSKLSGIESNAKDDQTITAGSGLTGGGTGDVTLNHADTSSQGSVNNSGATVIQDVTLDGFGHVTGLSSHTLTLADLGGSASADAIFTSATAPSNPQIADIYYNTTNGIVYLYDGTVWSPINDSPPAPTAGTFTASYNGSYSFSRNLSNDFTDDTTPSSSFQISVNGLPTWLTFSGQTVSGNTPSVQSDTTYTFTATATDSSGQVSTPKTYSITVLAPVPALTGSNPSISYINYSLNNNNFYIITTAETNFSVPVTSGGILRMIMIGATGGVANGGQRSSGGFGCGQVLIPSGVSTVYGVVGGHGDNNRRGLPGGGTLGSNSYGISAGGAGYTGLFTSNSHSINNAIAIVGGSGGSGHYSAAVSGGGGGFNLNGGTGIGGASGNFNAGGGTLTAGGVPASTSLWYTSNNQGPGSALNGGRASDSQYDAGSSGGAGYYGGAGGVGGGGIDGHPGGGGSGYLNLTMNGVVHHASTGTTSSQPSNMAADINAAFGWSNAQTLLNQLGGNIGQAHNSGNSGGAGTGGAMILW